MNTSELETVILIDYETKTANIYSNYSPFIKKIEKLAKENNIETSCKYGDDTINLKVPMKWVSVKGPRKYTEEQLEILRNRMKEMVKNNGTNSNKQSS